MPVAAALRAAGQWDLDHPRDFDADEWWYRCRFTSPAAEPTRGFVSTVSPRSPTCGSTVRTSCRSDNMFLAHAVDVSGVLAADNELFLRFRALAPLLAARRPRPDGARGWSRISSSAGTARRCSAACLAGVRQWRRSGRGVPILLEPGVPASRRRGGHSHALEGDDGRRRAVDSPDRCRGDSPVGTLARRVSRAARSRLQQMPTDGRVSGDRSNCRTPSDGGRTRTVATALSGPGCRSTWRTATSDSISVASAFGRLKSIVTRMARVSASSSTALPVFCRGACWTPLDRGPARCRRRRLSRRARTLARRRHEHAARRRHDGLRDRRLLRPLRRARASSSGRTSCSPTWTTRRRRGVRCMR